MDTSARFSKAEMLDQLRNALLLFVRSTSWVLDYDAAPRLLGWPPGAGEDALRNVEVTDFREVERQDRQIIDFTRFPILRTFEEFYDFGLLGFRRHGAGDMHSGTEYTFAIAALFDLKRSVLISDMHNGDNPCSVALCLEAARAAVAREILDGGERFYHESADLPWDLLTIEEVALLANMKVPSVRNAASGTQTKDSLKTVVRDGSRFVTREAAMEWLLNRRGFVRTKSEGPLAGIDLGKRGFQNAQEAIDYIVQRGELIGVYNGALHVVDDPSPIQGLTEAALRSVEKIDQIAALLKIDRRLLHLRIQEVLAVEELARVRQELALAGERKS
jgi:hypothetical protein